MQVPAMTNFDLEAAIDGLAINRSNKRVAPNNKVRTTPEETPALSMKGHEGTLTTRAMSGNETPQWSDILTLWDLDPNEFEVIEPVTFNSWEAQKDGEIVQMRQYKARIQRRTGVDERADLDALVASISKRKARKQPANISGEGDFCVVLADWQTGKGEGGGSARLVERIKQAIVDVSARVKELRKAGRSLGTLNVIWPGDSVEGCGDHYAMQTFQTDLDRRGQIKLATAMLDAALAEWSTMFERVRVVAVGGNHGENRKNGKAYTTFGDNDDLLVVENVQYAYAKNPDRYGHIEFILPDDHLNAVVRVAGGAWSLGVTHGHLSRSGAGVEGRVANWFGKQAAGKHAIGLVDILVTGHYHHLRTVDFGGWYWIQAPALDGGSEWFTQTSGQYSEPGVLTFAIYPDKRIADLQVL